MTTMKDRLRIVPQFRPHEYERYRDLVLGNLERRLERWEPEQVELELAVNARDTNSQRTVLKCWIAGLPKIVASSEEADLDKAVVEVRNDVRRQVNRLVTRKEDARKRGDG